MGLSIGTRRAHLDTSVIMIFVGEGYIPRLHGYDRGDVLEGVERALSRLRNSHVTARISMYALGEAAAVIWRKELDPRKALESLGKALKKVSELVGDMDVYVPPKEGGDGRGFHAMIADLLRRDERLGVRDAEVLVSAVLDPDAEFLYLLGESGKSGLISSSVVREFVQRHRSELGMKKLGLQNLLDEIHQS